MTRTEIEAALVLAERAEDDPWSSSTRDIGAGVPAPMVWDGHGDAIVSQMPDGKMYFEPGTAEFVAASRTLVPALARQLLAAMRVLDALAGFHRAITTDALNAAWKIVQQAEREYRAEYEK